MKCSRDEVRKLEIPPTKNRFASAAKKTTAAHGCGVRMQRTFCPHSCVCWHYFGTLAYMFEDALYRYDDVLMERLRRVNYLGAPPGGNINTLENRIKRVEIRQVALRRAVQKDFTNINRVRERNEVRYNQIMAAVGIMANLNVAHRHNCSMAAKLLFQSYGRKADGKYNVPKGAYPTPKALYQFLRANRKEVIAEVEDIVRKPR